MEPKNVVEWNVILFSVMAGVSGLQTLLCAVNIMNTLLGLVLGHGFCHNKVTVCCKRKQENEKGDKANKKYVYKIKAELIKAEQFIYLGSRCHTENVQLMCNMILCVSYRSLQFLFEMCLRF